MLRGILALVLGVVSLSALAAEDIALTVDQYDSLRKRTTIKVVDASQVPLGTTLRVHGKVGTCEIRIIEQVNDHLIGATEGCDNGVLNPGMNLAYSKPQWDQPSFQPAAQRTEASYTPNELLTEILNRTSVHVGHNFSRQLEGNVYNDGSITDLRGGTALSLGLKGRVYDFTDRLSLATEIGYESPRTLDRATYRLNGEAIDQGTQGFSPRLSLWSFNVQGEAKIMEKMNAFLGFNLSLPALRNSPFDVDPALGFQGGANYLVWDKIAVEGLIKITNMNFQNDRGQTTDVTLAGFELRGRYNF